MSLMQEKGNGALHIATQANQSSQVELLLVYGADPGSFDAHGRTPADIARLVLDVFACFINVILCCCSI